MKSLYIKDKHRRHLFKKFEIQYCYNQFLKIFSEFQNKHLLVTLKLKENNLKRIGKFRIRINSRCLLTNRSKAVYRKFHISRIQLRMFALKGLLGGVRKGSW
jgi:ribosomal protein S14